MDVATNVSCVSTTWPSALVSNLFTSHFYSPPVFFSPYPRTIDGIMFYRPLLFFIFLFIYWVTTHVGIMALPHVLSSWTCECLQPPRKISSLCNCTQYLSTYLPHSFISHIILCVMDDNKRVAVIYSGPFDIDCALIPVGVGGDQEATWK